MATVTFPYPDLSPLDIPDDNFAGIFESPHEVPRGSAQDLITESLRDPVGPPLDALVDANSRVLILVDDITRPTRADLILPVLCDRLAELGVADADIKILMALGTHRPMTPSEIATKVGTEICQRFAVANHEWLNPAALTDLGESASGIRILANAAIREADLVIGVGHIAPHAAAGFGGGGKIILPGICGQATTLEMHKLATSFGKGQLKGKVRNPVREEINDIAVRAGLRFIVNVVQNPQGEILEVFSGEPCQAHRNGAERSRQVFGTELPGQFDIVVIDSYPADLDLWQAGKAIDAAEQVARPGGAIILVTPCPDGISPEHTAWPELSPLEPAAIRQMIADGLVEDKVGAHAAVNFQETTAQRHIIVVSPGIPPKDKARLRLHHAPDPASALAQAMEVIGADASVAVLHGGGEILPLLPT